MRTRDEIEQDIATPGLVGATVPNADRLLFELLLDIRDRLESVEETIGALDDLVDRRTQHK